MAIRRVDPSRDPSPFSRPRPAEDSAARHERIARAAYERARTRGFEPGHELEDWLAAEQEIDGGDSDRREPH